MSRDGCRCPLLNRRLRPGKNLLVTSEFPQTTIRAQPVVPRSDTPHGPFSRGNGRGYRVVGGSIGVEVQYGHT